MGFSPPNLPSISDIVSSISSFSKKIEDNKYFSSLKVLGENFFSKVDKDVIKKLTNYPIKATVAETFSKVTDIFLGVLPETDIATMRSTAKVTAEAVLHSIKETVKGVAATIKEAVPKSGIFADSHIATEKLSDNVKKTSSRIQTGSYRVLSGEPHNEEITERSTLTGSHQEGKDDASDHLEFEFKDGDTLIAKDVVDNIDTIPKSISSLKRTKVEIKKELGTTEDLNKKAELTLKLEFIETALKNLQPDNAVSDTSSPSKKPKEWIDSNYHRDQLKNLSISEKGKTQKEVNKAFKERNDEQILTCPVNMRYQQLKNAKAEKVAGFVRTGVICNLSNGFVSVNDIKMFIENNAARDRKVEELEKLKEKYKKDPIKIAAVQCAIDEIKDVDACKKTQAKADFMLEQQMLHLLETQVTNNPGKIKKSMPFHFGHVSLLNPRKNEVDETGWCHNEANEIQDMQYAFKKFEGRKIVFDVTPENSTASSYIDAEGTIHMRRPPSVAKNVTEITIGRTAFANISVQGHTKNDGMQKEINKTAIEEYRLIADDNKTNGIIDEEQHKAFNESMKEVEGMLKKGQSSYLVAEKFEAALLAGGIVFSHGCLSAKDRTGYVSYRVMFNKALGLASKSKEFKTAYEGQAFSTKGNGSRIVEANTGAKALKVSPFFLPGIKIFDRIRHYLKQGAELLV